MVQSARPISRAAWPLASAFVPALLLSLVLGAALVFRQMPRQAPPEAAPAGRPAEAGATLPGHHTDPNAAGIVAPGEWLGDSEPGHHTASPRPVAEQLAARPADVEFCVGSTLEPFDATWAQLLAIGPGEAAERTRRCLMELVFTHVDPDTAASVRAQLPAFGACYQRAIDLPNPDSGRVRAEVTGCLTSLTGKSN